MNEWIEVRIAFEHFIWDALNILDKFNEIEVKVVVDNYAPDPESAKVCFNFDFVISIIQPVLYLFFLQFSLFPLKFLALLHNVSDKDKTRIIFKIALVLYCELDKLGAVCCIMIK